MTTRSQHAAWLAVLGMTMGALSRPAVADLETIAVDPGTAPESAETQERPPEGSGLEEIIVTAQKRAENVQEVPIAITALSGEALESHGVNDIEGLTKLIPALKFNGSFTPVNASIRVRGVGTEVLTASAEPNVSVVVDGVPLARTELVNFQFADLERVEVLRGPQGTLFGKNATAGVVSVVTRDPSQDFEAFAQANAEKAIDWPGGEQVVKVGVSGPVTDETAFRISGFYKRTDGHLIDVVNDEHLPGGNDWGVRAKGLWKSSGSVVARLTLESVDGDSEPAPFLFGSANPGKQARDNFGIDYDSRNREAKTSGHDRLASDNDSVALSVDWDLDEITATSITGYRRYDLKRRQSVIGLDGDRLDITATIGRRKLDTFSQELRLTSAGDQLIEYTAGVLWFHHKVYDRLYNQADNIPVSAFVGGTALGGLLHYPGIIPGNIDSLQQRTDNIGDARTNNIGVFAQGTWHMTDRSHLTLGTRYIYEKQLADSYLNVRTNTTAGGVPLSNTTQDPSEAALKDHHVIGRAALKFDLNESSNVYSSVSSGYRAGTYDIGATDLDLAFSQPVKPETVTSFEIGSKSRFFDRRLELNVAGFISVFKDFQAQVADVPPPNPTNVALAFQYKLANAGELRTKGVELEFKAMPTDSLYITGFVLLNDAIFKKFIAPCFVGQAVGERGGIDENSDGRCDTQDVSGSTLPNAPKRSASISAGYDLPGRMVGGTTNLQLSGRWQSKTQFDASQHPLTFQDSYSVWDLRVGWKREDDRLELAAFATNIFNQFYVNGYFPLSVENDRRDYVHYVPRDATMQLGVSINYQFR